MCARRAVSFGVLSLLSCEVEAQEVHVGRGVDDAQGAVDLEGVDAGGAVEALREDALEDVAGADVLLGGLDGAEEVFACGARGELEGLGDIGAGGFVQRGFEKGFEAVETDVGVGVGGCGGDRAAEVCGRQR